MSASPLRWVVALVALQPGVAMAQWSLRLALEVPLHTHVFPVQGETTSTSIADTFQPGVDLLGSYAVLEALSIDLEFRTGLFATGSGHARTRTTIGPGLTYDVQGFPLYGRVAFPIQVESGVMFFVRPGGGLKILDLGFFRAYVELMVDVALGGNGVKLGSHTVNAVVGVWFRL
jgi:hypothetical protein